MRKACCEFIDAAQVNVLHVCSRTVRRCFLFGDDPLTGKNYDHRKAWIEDSLQHFAGHFGIDLLAYAVMSNHFHLVLRNRPDVVASWSDTEVARRWLMICPHRKDKAGKPLPPSASELNTIRHCPVRLKEIRGRLADPSWWMRFLCQHVARRANIEEDASGRFFEQRYKIARRSGSDRLCSVRGSEPGFQRICQTLQRQRVLADVDAGVSRIARLDGPSNSPGQTQQEARGRSAGGRTSRPVGGIVARACGQFWSFVP